MVMLKHRKNSNTFYCFSPPVMIATFLIETSLLCYTLWRYKMTALTRLIATTIGLLAAFQFAEYHVCQGMSGNIYSRIGFIAITFLPPLGLHLVRTISGRGSQYLVWAAYASGLAFALTFGFADNAFISNVCAGNYAVFQLRPGLGGMYFMYYYFWLIVGIVQCQMYSMTAKPKIREALTFQAMGYLSFILPVGIVNALNPTTIDGIPSIMCGFAVIYALLLAFGITPRVLSEKSAVKTHTV
jgi:hypothetical protein